MAREYYGTDDGGSNYEPGYDPSVMSPPPSMASYGSYPGPISQPLNDPTIAHMRWVPDELTHMIYKRLAGVTINVVNGEVKYLPIPGVEAKMNQEGIEFILTSIEGVINQFVGLSCISDEEANELIAQYLYGLAGDLVYNQGRFKLHTGDMRLVMNLVKALVFSQVKRAVKGHESRNFTTQHVEQNTQQHFTQGQQQSNWLLNPFKKSRGGG